MAKKLRKKQTIEALAANFDRAQFDQLVAAKEADLRDKVVQEGPSKRLLKLEIQYKSRDTAFLILAEEKVRCKIRRRQNPNECDTTTEALTRHDTYIANMHRQPRRRPAREWNDDSPPLPATAGRGIGNWRNWGHDM